MKLHHVALSVQDLQAAIEFYTKLGFKEVTAWQADDHSIQIAQMESDSGRIELFHYQDSRTGDHTDKFAGDLARTGIKHFAISVHDIQAFIGDLKTLGVEPVSALQRARSSASRYIFYQDPEGNWVEVVGR